MIRSKAKTKKNSLKRKFFEDDRKKTSLLAKKSKIKSVKKTFMDSETSDSNVGLPENKSFEDDEMDDIEISIKDQNNDKCIYCDDSGRQNKEWYRCVSCGFWAHSECSG